MPRVANVSSVAVANTVVRPPSCSTNTTVRQLAKERLSFGRKCGTSFFGMGWSVDAFGILEAVMDKDRVKGSATNVGGKVKEGAGKLTGDQKLQGEGKADQAKGKVQNAVGGIKDALKGKS